jgi:hypothetical protein
MNISEFPTPDDVKPTDETLAKELGYIAEEIGYGKRSFSLHSNIAAYLIAPIRSRGWGVTWHQRGNDIDLSLWIPREKLDTPEAPTHIDVALADARSDLAHTKASLDLLGRACEQIVQLETLHPFEALATPVDHPAVAAADRMRRARDVALSDVKRIRYRDDETKAASYPAAADRP